MDKSWDKGAVSRGRWRTQRVEYVHRELGRGCRYRAEREGLTEQDPRERGMRAQVAFEGKRDI